MHRLFLHLTPLAVFFFSIPLARADSAPRFALRPGEVFVYRVGWGIFGGAGEIRISARTETLEGLPQLHLISSTNTRGLVHAFFPFTGEADSIFDARDGRLLAMRASSNHGHTRTDTSMVIDYDHRTASYANYVHPERNNPALPVPPGHPMDFITSLINARTYDMKPGDKRPLLVIFDDEFYELTIAADHYETLNGPLGEFNTLLLIPYMEKEPKGMFKRGGEVRVWISQDERHLPVRFEVKLKVGTAVAQLVGYTPPPIGKKAESRKD